MIYTDKIHLVADSIRELHDFAQTIGLKRNFFHGVRKGHPHYDITNSFIREMVVQSGAKIISSKEILKISKNLVISYNKKTV